MHSFTLTGKARTDIKSILIYTQKRWGKEQRRLYAKQFDDAFVLLSDNAEIGKECDFIKPGYKKFPLASHIIFLERSIPAILRLFVFCINVWMFRTSKRFDNVA